jgi:hypothetical protein
MHEIFFPPLYSAIYGIMRSGSTGVPDMRAEIRAWEFHSAVVIFFSFLSGLFDFSSFLVFFFSMGSAF